MLAAVSYFLQWLLQLGAVAVHWVADSPFAPLVAFGFLLLTYMFVFLSERRIRQMLAEHFKVEPAKIAVGPLHARAAWLTLLIAAGHALLHLLSRLLLAEGTAHYGPEGWVLGALGLDVLVPLPYMVALPAAMAFYGYVYCVVLYGSSLSLAEMTRPIWAYARGIVAVPLLPLRFFGGLFARRGGKDKQEKRPGTEELPPSDAAGGEGEPGETPPAPKQAPEPEPEPEPELAPPAFGENPKWILLHGAHRRSTVDKPLLPNFRLFPRYHRIVQPFAGPLLLAVIVCLAIPFLLSSERPDVDLPVGFDEYRASLQAIDPGSSGARSWSLLPGPFRDGIPAGQQQPLSELTISSPGTTDAEYECSAEAYDGLSRAARAAGDPLERARGVLNAALCGRGLGGLSANLSELRFRVAGFDLLSMRRRDDELWRVRRAADALRGTPDEARGLWIAGVVHSQPGYTRAAQELFERAVAAGGKTDAETFLALVQHARLLVRLNRFDEVERLVGQYADGVWSKRNGGGPAGLAFAGLVRLNQAALLAEVYLAADATELLADLDGVLQGEPRLEPLRGSAQNLREQLDADPKTAQWRAEAALFGVLPTSLLAALLLYMIGLRKLVRTPLETREAPAEPEKEEGAAKGRPKAEEVPIDAVLGALRQVGMCVSGPIPLKEGAARGKLEVEMAQAVADLERQIDGVAGPLPDDSPGPDLLAPAAPAAAAPEQARAKALASSDRVTEAFLQELLRERGCFHGTNRGLYRHQRRALELLGEAKATGAAGTTVVLATPARSGRTTVALVAAMEALAEGGQSVLFVCADARHAREQAEFFTRIRSREVWSWNVSAVSGAEQLETALRDANPMHLLFVDPLTVHRSILPLARQAQLHGFLRSLGLLVVEDLHRFAPAALAHGSFVFRRLGGVLAALEQRPVTLATTLPVMAREEDFARDLLGALAREVRFVPAESDDAEQAEQQAYLLVPKPEDERPYPACSPEHTAAAAVQARGYSAATGETVWPTALVGFDATAEREDRALSIYSAFGASRILPLADSDRSRAVVFPVTAATIGALDALTRHAGIASPAVRPAGTPGPEPGTPPAEAAEQGEESEGEAEPEEEKKAGGPPQHTVFLLEGPEPIDDFLALRLVTDALRAGRTRELLWGLRPEAVVPRRNRHVGELHFERALGERAVPGQSVRFLGEVFEDDLLREASQRAERLGRLDVNAVPVIQPEDGRLGEEIRMTAPRFRDDQGELRLQTYSTEVMAVVDRASGRRLDLCEKCRAAAVYHPGRIFVVGGARYVVLGRRFQTAWERGDLFVEPYPAAQRSSRIRQCSLRAQTDDNALPATMWQIGRGREFAVGFSGIVYREEVIGRRLHPAGGVTIDAREQFTADEVELSTEALVLGFDAEAFALPKDAPAQRRILHAVTLLLRQALPLALRYRPDDLELAFGSGAAAGPGGRASAESLAPFRLQRPPSTRPLPWLAFIDRMDGALGYARVLHQRLLEGTLVPELLRVALALARKANAEGDVMRVVRTTLNVEPEDTAGADVDGAAELLAALLGQDLERRQRPRSRTTAPVVSDAEAAEEESDVEGAPARRALLDPLGLGGLETALAEHVLPEWSGATAEPWAFAFECALRALVPDGVRACDVERAVMALLALRRRETGDALLAPPAGVARLAGYRPQQVGGPLDEIPEIGEPPQTAVDVACGRLSRAMGLFTASGALTERGCHLARSLIQAPGFRAAFDAIAAAVASGQARPESPSVEQLVAGLCRAELPLASRRLLAEGLGQVPSVRVFGRAWHASLDGGPQPDAVGRQLEKLATFERLPEDAAGMVALLHAAHAFDAECRNLASRIRAILSGRQELRLSEVAAGDLAVAVRAVRDHARRLVERMADRIEPEAEVRRFLETVGSADEPAQTLRVLLARMHKIAGDDAPLALDFGRIRLGPGWQKKHPYSDARGLRFRLHLLGRMMVETGYRPSVPPRLDGRAPVTCAVDEPLAAAWTAPADAPARTGGPAPAAGTAPAAAEAPRPRTAEPPPAPATSAAVAPPVPPVAVPPRAIPPSSPPPSQPTIVPPPRATTPEPPADALIWAICGVVGDDLETGPAGIELGPTDVPGSGVALSIGGLLGRRELAGPGGKALFDCRFRFRARTAGRELWVRLRLPVASYVELRNRPRCYGVASPYVLDPVDRAVTRVLAEAVLAKAEALRLTPVQQVDALVKLAQHLQYRRDIEDRRVIEYPRYPVETLVEGGGDCEDLAALAGSLCSFASGIRVAFLGFRLRGTGHMALGLRGIDVPGARTFERDGHAWVFVETSDPFPIGELPDADAHLESIETLAPRPYLDAKSTLRWTEGSDAHAVLRLELVNRGMSDAKAASVEAWYEDPLAGETAHELRTLSPVPQGGAVVVCEVRLPAPPGPHARFAFRLRAEEFESSIWRSEEKK